jgi:hypothetical protein
VASCGSGSVLAAAEVDPARTEALAAGPAEGGAGAGVDAGVSAVEAVGPAAAARALLLGVVLGVWAAGLEADQVRRTVLGDALLPADGAPVRVVGHRGADTLSAALDAAPKASVLLDAAHAMPVLPIRPAVCGWLPATGDGRRIARLGGDWPW